MAEQGDERDQSLSGDVFADRGVDEETTGTNDAEGSGDAADAADEGTDRDPIDDENYDDNIDHTYGFDEDPTVFGSRGRSGRSRSRSGSGRSGSGRSGSSRRRSSRRKKSWRDRKVLIAAIVMLLLPMLLLGGYLLWLNRIIDNNITHDASLMPNKGQVYPGDVPVDQSTGKGMNLLVIGNDAGPDRQGARGDVLILAHIPEDRSKIYLIHMPRDLYVPIPGKGSNKINAAYAFGGGALQVRTIQNMLGGARIDHVALVGFEGFKNMTDAVGGVDVLVEQGTHPHEKTGFEECDFSAGVKHMNGKCGLAFVRQRYELKLGDIDRGRRQMAYVKALSMKGLSSSVLLNPLKLADFLDAATSNLTVDKDFTTADMRSLALSLRNVRGPDIVFVTAPYAGFGWAGQQSIVNVDKPKMAALGKAIREDRVDQYISQYVK